MAYRRAEEVRHERRRALASGGRGRGERAGVGRLRGNVRVDCVRQEQTINIDGHAAAWM